MAVRAELLLIHANIFNPRDDPDARAPGGFLVDGVFHLDFYPAAEKRQCWTCGTYEDIDLAPGNETIESRLEFFARSAADDVVADMVEAGYEPSGRVEKLRIIWTINADVTSRFGTA